MNRIFVIVFLSIHSLIYSQGVEVKYRVTHFDFIIPQEFKDNAGYTMIKNRYNNIKIHAKDIEFKLIADSKLSLSENIQILEPPKDTYKSIRTGLTAMNLNGSFYSDHLASTNYHKKTVAGEEFTIVTKYNDRKWRLINENKLFLGYNCFKATTTDTITNSKGAFYKKITAWYCPEISINSGLGAFVGLPGLVLGIEIQESNKSYKLEAYKIKKINKVKTDFVIVNPTTQKELDSILSKKSKELKGY